MTLKCLIQFEYVPNTAFLERVNFLNFPSISTINTQHKYVLCFENAVGPVTLTRGVWKGSIFQKPPSQHQAYLCLTRKCLCQDKQKGDDLQPGLPRSPPATAGGGRGDRARQGRALCLALQRGDRAVLLKSPWRLGCSLISGLRLGTRGVDRRP